jgi:uridine kinase
MPVFESLIEPIKHKADFVIPNNYHFARAIRVLAGFLKTQI